MTKKMKNQNTRLMEEDLAFLEEVANRLGTNRSDVIRRVVHEWQRFGPIGAAEALRNCSGLRSLNGLIKTKSLVDDAALTPAPLMPATGVVSVHFLNIIHCQPAPCPQRRSTGQ